MKSFMILAVLVAVAAAAPADRDANIQQQTFNNIGTGEYDHGFQSDNGLSAQAQGTLVNEGTDNEAQVVRGSFSYVGPDNVVYSVNYIADQDGFRPEGAHLNH